MRCERPEGAVQSEPSSCTTQGKPLAGEGAYITRRECSRHDRRQRSGVWRGAKAGSHKAVAARGIIVFQIGLLLPFKSAVHLIMLLCLRAGLKFCLSFFATRECSCCLADAYTRCAAAQPWHGTYVPVSTQA